ncbi:MAG: hypothetical protein JST40_14525 [Armatimonadetes bacterium]|nr:hypothetical protein [Armatimonadota bacterium]
MEHTKLHDALAPGGSLYTQRQLQRIYAERQSPIKIVDIGELQQVFSATPHGFEQEQRLLEEIDSAAEAKPRAIILDLDLSKDSDTAYNANDRKLFKALSNIAERHPSTKFFSGFLRGVTRAADPFEGLLTNVTYGVPRERTKPASSGFVDSYALQRWLSIPATGNRIEEPLLVPMIGRTLGVQQPPQKRLFVLSSRFVDPETPDSTLAPVNFEIAPWLEANVIALGESKTKVQKGDILIFGNFSHPDPNDTALIPGVNSNSATLLLGSTLHSHLFQPLWFASSSDAYLANVIVGLIGYVIKAILDLGLSLLKFLQKEKAEIICLVLTCALVFLIVTELLPRHHIIVTGFVSTVLFLIGEHFFHKLLHASKDPSHP